MTLSPLKRTLVLKAIARLGAEHGVLLSDLAADLAHTGADSLRISVALAQMAAKGRVFVWKRPMHSRYFVSAEARDAAVGYLEAEHKRYCAERDVRKREAKKVRNRSAYDRQRPQKPVAAAKGKPAGVTIKAPRQAAEIVMREGLQVQVCPGYTGDRWQVSGPVVGGFATLGVGRYLDAA